MRRILSAACLLSVALAAAGCGGPRITTNGFVFSGLDLAFLDESEVLCSEVHERLGTPTLTRSLVGGGLGPDVWLYAGQRTSYYAFYKPEVVQEQVLALRFGAPLEGGESVCGDDPAVIEVRRYTLEDGRVLAFNENVTPVAGNERTLLQEFLGDLGRFSRPAF